MRDAQRRLGTVHQRSRSGEDEEDSLTGTQEYGLAEKGSKQALGPEGNLKHGFVEDEKESILDFEDNIE